MLGPTNKHEECQSPQKALFTMVSTHCRGFHQATGDHSSNGTPAGTLGLCGQTSHAQNA